MKRMLRKSKNAFTSLKNLMGHKGISLTGFTLVELMIAIGIIISLAALSITGLFRARITASESSAIESLKTLQAAFENYRMINPTYPVDFTDLCTTNPPYLGTGWYNERTPRYSNVIQGYVYEIKDMVGGLQNEQYMIVAFPSNAIYTARIFYIQQDGEIFDADAGAVGAAGPE